MFMKVKSYLYKKFLYYTKLPRLIRKIKSLKLNALNSYNIYTYFNFPLDSIEEFKVALSNGYFISRTNYDVYSKITESVNKEKQSFRWFKLPDVIDAEAYLKHHKEFNAFLDDLLYIYIEIKYASYIKGVQHTNTYLLKVIEEIMIKFLNNYRVRNKEIRLYLLKDNLTLEL